MPSLREICTDLSAASSYKLEPGLQNDFASVNATAPAAKADRTIFRESKIADPGLELKR